MTIIITKTKLAIAIVAMALIGATAAMAVDDNPFTDVPDSEEAGAPFFSEPVEWLWDNGLTTGTSATTFSPNDNVTRGQYAAFNFRYDQSIVQPALAAQQAEIDAAEAAANTNTAAIAAKQDKPSGASALVIPAAAFQPAADSSSGVDYDYSAAFRSGGSGDSSCVIAPVFLPNGVTVTSVTANVSNSDGGTVNMILRRDPAGFEFAETMASVPSPDNSGDQSLVDSEINDAIIDSAAYGYALDSCNLSSPTSRIHNVVIAFTYPE